MIPAPLLYLLQMQVALLLLLGVYYGLLRRLTFHQLNRVYLLAALVLAALYPALDLSRLLPAPAARAAQPLALVLPTWPASTSPSAVATGPDYGAWLLGLYAVGAGLLLVRLLVQAASLWRLHRASQPARVGGVEFRAVGAVVSPFSFGRAIYLNPAHHAPAELPVVLLHEQVHVRQAHTFDVLLGHLHQVLAWASPAAWLWLRATQENLEFLADAAVLRESRLPARQYQYSLARLSTLAQGPALTTPFSFLILKNRITMMNTRPSSSRQLLRYAAVLPLAAGLLLTTAATTATPVTAPLAALKAMPADVEKDAPISALPPAALAYIVQQYPGYRLIGVAEVRAADGTNLRYKAQIAIGRRPTDVLFDEKGQPVQTGNPLVFVDGKRVSKAELDKLDPKQIESMNVLKKSEDLKSFGSDAADGVILIITKQNKNSATVRAFMREHNIVLTPASPEVQRITQLVTSGQGLSATDLQGRLLIVNNQEATVEKSKVAESQLQSVFVMDAEQAVKKYGNEGAKGAVIIMTK